MEFMKDGEYINISELKSKEEQIIMILNQFLLRRADRIDIEIPRGFLVSNSINYKQYLIGRKIIIRVNEENAPRSITLKIIKEHDDYEQLFYMEFSKNFREFTDKDVHLNITLKERGLVKRIIEEFEPYSLNVKTI